MQAYKYCCLFVSGVFFTKHNFSRCIHIACTTTSFLLQTNNTSLYVPHLSIHQLVNTASFFVVAIIVNTGTQVFVWKYFKLLLDKHLVMELISHIVIV